MRRCLLVETAICINTYINFNNRFNYGNYTKTYNSSEYMTGNSSISTCKLPSNCIKKPWEMIFFISQVNLHVLYFSVLFIPVQRSCYCSIGAVRAVIE